MTSFTTRLVVPRTLAVASTTFKLGIVVVAVLAAAALFAFGAKAVSLDFFGFGGVTLSALLLHGVGGSRCQQGRR
jgi:hypothetical protein